MIDLRANGHLSRPAMQIRRWYGLFWVEEEAVVNEEIVLKGVVQSK